MVLQKRHLNFAVLAISVVLCEHAQAQYQLGPRGGCYTVTKSGSKRYVDRSLCEAKAPTRRVETPSIRSGLAVGGDPDTPTKAEQKALAKFIRGPRGGCYTVSASGTKRYVDRSLCESEVSSSQARATLQAQKDDSQEQGASPYLRGPRGGCYTVSASGRKRYVDRSLCQ